jgi:hypothetical protein
MRGRARIGPPIRGDNGYAENRPVFVWSLQCRSLCRADDGQRVPLSGLPAPVRRAMEQCRVLSEGSRPPRWSEQDICPDERLRDSYQPPFLPDLWGDCLLDPGDGLHAIWNPGWDIQRSVISRAIAVGLGKTPVRVVACAGKSGSLGYAASASAFSSSLRFLIAAWRTVLQIGRWPQHWRLPRERKGLIRSARQPRSERMAGPQGRAPWRSRR